jgi:hypothetical protein
MPSDITLETLEALKRDLKYNMSSLNISNFEPITQAKMQTLFNNADSLLKMIDNIPSAKKIQDIVFPVNSMYMTYNSIETPISPALYGTWLHENTMYTDNEPGYIFIWRRTA